MQVKLMAFGIAREIIGEREMPLQVTTATTVQALKNALYEQYPALARLASLAVAVNGVYAADEVILREADEVVLIPPVSGG